MPSYEFRCRKCQKNFEVIRAISAFDPKKIKCPECGSKQVDQRWSAVFAVTSKKS